MAEKADHACPCPRPELSQFRGNSIARRGERMCCSVSSPSLCPDSVLKALHTNMCKDILTDIKCKKCKERTDGS